MTLDSQAKSLGIPMKMMVTDDLRYSYCDAFEAVLMSIEGTMAMYAGTCMNGHIYEQKFQITELQKMARIENGEIVVGQDKGFKADELEDF